MKSDFAMAENRITLSARSRFRAAMILAVVADALQILIFPVFVEGALSPADDVLDVTVAAVMVHLLGWHWEFLPTVFAKLLPGVDLVPFWTLAEILARSGTFRGQIARRKPENSLKSVR